MKNGKEIIERKKEEKENEGHFYNNNKGTLGFSHRPIQRHY